MPKIIENIEENISNAVIKLISQHGYNSTNMKMIAKEAGIAVGTLYNYYSDKEELTTTVIYKSWLDTLRVLDEITKEKNDISTKINNFVITLYTEICKRKGIGNELINKNIFKKEILEEINLKLKTNFETLLLELENKKESKLNSEYKSRLIDAIILTIINLANTYENKDEENIIFLKEFLSKLLI